MAEKGQTTNPASEPVVLEAAGRARAEQETGAHPAARVSKEVSSDASGEAEAEAEVPLVRKRRRLTRLGDMVPAREVTPTGGGVPTGEGSTRADEGRQAREVPRTGEGCAEPRADLPLIIVPAERSAQGERPAQARMMRALSEVQATLCAAPGRLGIIEGEAAQTNTAGEARETVEADQ